MGTQLPGSRAGTAFLKKDWHKFRAGGLRALLDVNTGSLYSIDEITWDLLDVYDGTNQEEALSALSTRYDVSDVEEAIAELEELRRTGRFARPDPVGLSYIPPEPDHVKALCLLVTNDCNLRCRYCFAKGGRIDRSKMSPEVARRSLDFLFAGLGKRSRCEVDFFGGEPLLVFDVVKDAILYGEEKARAAGKTIKFTLTTNGILLNDEIVRLLLDHRVSVILSMDGRPGVHDEMRVFPGGGGTYQAVLAKYKRYVLGEPEFGSDGQKRPASDTGSPLRFNDYWVRGTFTRQSLDFASDVEHLVNLGFDKISMEPVIAGEEAPYAIRQEDLERLRREYEKLFAFYVRSARTGRRFSFYHFIVPSDGGPCVYKRLTGCGAGVEYFAVAPSGDLYPCHRFAGHGEFKMGDVFSGIDPGKGEALRRRFAGTHVYSKDVCASCWARFYCGGGCHASAYEFNGDISIPYALGCELMKMRLEYALLAEMALAQSDAKIS
ncbi:MAG: thioether cross-link-forming SCIFF peptide maturase [Firmicutes bacterium]|nr:thioether cross-link-forming SCIFF peptide maturase [Candidatus Fermentithermobacillaceae bacterium]